MKRSNRPRLPRKRKKLFIKELGRSNYMAYCLISEIDLEGNPHSKTAHKFSKYGLNTLKILKTY